MTRTVIHPEMRSLPDPPTVPPAIPPTVPWARVEAAFEAVLDAPPEARAAVLDAACREPDGTPYPALRAEVERLLALDGEAGDSWLDAPVLAPEAVPADVPERVGPWRVTREVGRGGMGRVYEGLRDDGAFEQRVAVKVVESAAPGTVQRFVQERRILAGLRHEGIARLLDGGGLPDGRPYLVMEFVDGTPLVAFADDHGLGVEARLRLFVGVCDAVAHAHRALVVHRDLKPSNVLVEARAEGLAVKLLDFGIARLLDDAPDAAGADVADAGEATLTRFGQQILTPAYAAPEQVRGETVSTATDVYALGVLLCELLTGRRPPPATGAPPEARPALASELAGDPGTPAAPGARLRGDLDAVIGRATAFAPADRYGSAEALAADLRRHLAHVPVEARAATTGVRLRAFARRHRVGALAAALALAALVGGTALALWQAGRAARERDRAVATSEFLLDVFRDLDPDEAGAGTTSAQTLLDRAAARLRPALGDDPLTEAAVGAALGRAYGSLGAMERGEALLRQALIARRVRLGPGAVPTLETSAALGLLLTEAARYAEAESLLVGALADGEPALGPHHAAVAGVRHALGVNRVLSGDFARAEAPLQQALADRRAALGDRSAPVAQSLAGLGNLFHRQGRLPDAERAYRAAAVRYRALYGDAHPRLGLVLNEIALIRKNLGDYAGAEPVYREALDILRRVYGDHHPAVADALSNLGLLLKDRAVVDARPSLFASAAKHLEEALAIRRETYGDAHLLSAHTEAQLAMLELHRGRAAEAERRFRRSLAWHDAAETPPMHTARPYPMMGLGEALLEEGRAAEAEPVLREALRIRETATPGHWRIADNQSALAACLTALGQLDEARALLDAVDARIAEGNGEFGVTAIYAARRRADLDRAVSSARSPSRP